MRGNVMGGFGASSAGKEPERGGAIRMSSERVIEMYWICSLSLSTQASNFISTRHPLVTSLIVGGDLLICRNRFRGVFHLPVLAVGNTCNLLEHSFVGIISNADSVNLDS